MGIVVNLDVMMAKRKMSLGELAQRVDITMANLSILKNNRPGQCGFPRWRPSVRRWTVSRGIFWSMCRRRTSCSSRKVSDAGYMSITG